MTSSSVGPTSAPWWRANAHVAMFLSALVPGVGQVYAGQRRRGYWLLAITGVLAVILLTSLRDRTRWLV